MGAVNRTSFAGALVVIGFGAVLAFAIQGTPRDFDVQTAGVILILAGAADLVVRSLLADGRLLGRPGADVVTVVEPSAEPLVAPLPGTMPAGAEVDTLVVGDWPYEVTRIPASQIHGQGQAVGQGQAAGQGYGYVADSEPAPGPGLGLGFDPEGGGVAAGAVGPAGAAPYAAYDAAVRAAAGDLPDTPESPLTVTTLGGRPVRPRGRGFGRYRRSGRL